MLQNYQPNCLKNNQDLVFDIVLIMRPTRRMFKEDSVPRPTTATFVTLCVVENLLTGFTKKESELSSSVHL